MPSNWLKVTSRWSFSVRNWYPPELWVLAKAGAARLSASAPEATAASPMRRKEVFIIVSRSGGHHGFSGEAAALSLTRDRITSGPWGNLGRVGGKLGACRIRGHAPGVGRDPPRAVRLGAEHRAAVPG